jgi:glycosyltransferase involved in cell wall biosynthesis
VGWGLSVTEAAACATPSAALRLGGLTEAIEDGRTGLLADDVAELSSKVRALLADPVLRDALGAQARERVERFRWDDTARHTLALLDRERRRRDPRAVPAAGLVPVAVVPEGPAVSLA